MNLCENSVIKACPRCGAELMEERFGWKCAACKHSFQTMRINGVEYFMAWIDRNSAITKKAYIYGGTLPDDKALINAFGGIFGGHVVRYQTFAIVHAYVD